MACRKKFNYRNFLTFIFNIALIVTSVLLILSVLKFNGIENKIRYIICVFYSVIVLLLFIINFKNSFGKRKIALFLSSFLTIVLIALNIFVNYNTNKVFGLLTKISDNNQKISVSLVTLKSNNVSSKNEIKDSTIIGGVSSELSGDFSLSIAEYMIQNKMKNKVNEYNNYQDIVKDLNSKKIEYAFLPTEYSSLFSSDDDIDLDNIKVIDTYEKDKKVEIVSNKDLNKPFTILLMGVDTLTNAYNADTLMVITFNPDTLNSTILSIPRDTYTNISCTGKKRKINSSGLHGDECVIKTVEEYLGIDIDYYFKVNFKGLVKIVDLLGGVEVDVPYAFCEQDSNRNWGKNTIYVEKGLHKLNGEQALALTRNRHYWPKKCSKKYTTEGNRSDFTRGQNQQLVFKSILNKAKSINSISTVYKLLDALGNNMVTNMSTETILSVYEIGKNIVIKMNYQDRDISQILLIQKLKFTSTTERVQIGSYNMSVVINSEKSLEAVVEEMKKNLGLINSEDNKTIQFDINDSYEESTVGTGLSNNTKKIATLPNFVGKTVEYAKNFTTANNIKVNYEYVESSTYSENIVISQDTKPDTDISDIKVLNLKVSKAAVVIVQDKEEETVEEEKENNSSNEEQIDDDTQPIDDNNEQN